jgi:predicted DNA-binding transcriptional regulator AlpA
MSEPLWLKTISNHAVIKKSELLEWLGVSGPYLRLLITEQGFPPPRFGSFASKPGSKQITSASRWRVGDVRAWLEGSPKKLQNELQIEIGAERSPHIKALSAAGFDGMGGFKKPGV